MLGQAREGPEIEDRERVGSADLKAALELSRSARRKCPRGGAAGREEAGDSPRYSQLSGREGDLNGSQRMWRGR
jgi:hypothetical protein